MNAESDAYNYIETVFLEHGVHNLEPKVLNRIFSKAKITTTASAGVNAGRVHSCSALLSVISKNLDTIPKEGVDAFEEVGKQLVKGRSTQSSSKQIGSFLRLLEKKNIKNWEVVEGSMGEIVPKDQRALVRCM